MPPIAEGSGTAYFGVEPGVEFAFNADVQPAPTISSLEPRSGSFKGGNQVNISGTDFAGVDFGDVPAAGFTVDSEGQITAVTPAGAVGTTDVTVTTIAGTSSVTVADRFGYTTCVVPGLKHKKLKAAKKKLRKAGYKVGRVKRENGVTAKVGEVVKQGRKPGKKLAPGTKVNVTLG